VHRRLDILIRPPILPDAPSDSNLFGTYGAQLSDSTLGADPVPFLTPDWVPRFGSIAGSDCSFRRLGEFGLTFFTVLTDDGGDGGDGRALRDVHHAHPGGRTPLPRDRAYPHADDYTVS
jgi:hypothetical protein